MPGHTADVLGPALRALDRALRHLKAPWMVIGGAALILRGSPRATVDVDACMKGDAADLRSVVAALAREGIAPRAPDALKLAQETLVLLLVHKRSKVPIDLSMAWTGFEQEALARAEPLGEARVPTATAEDLIVQKALAWRPQDQQDIAFLAQAYGARLDVRRISHAVGALAGLLELPERPAELEELLRRSRPPKARRRAKPRRT